MFTVKAIFVQKYFKPLKSVGIYCIMDAIPQSLRTDRQAFSCDLSHCRQAGRMEFIMANYLPLSFNIENRPILIFGGGSKAYEKIEKLLPYGPRLTVAAEKVIPVIKQLGKEKKISVVRSNGSNAWMLLARLKPVFVIIADVDAEAIASIFKTCRKNNTEVHTVDQKDFCTFHFPSVIQKKNLSIAVAATGASAEAARWVVNHIEKSLPAAIDSTLEHLAAFRLKLAEKSAGLKSSKFVTIYRDFLDTALRENRVLSAGEMAQLMAKHMEES